MNKFLSGTARLGQAGFRHVSAFIAVLLVIAALIIGYRLGRPAPEATLEGETDVEVIATTSGEPQTYTCSMHPAVRLPDADAKCPICFMDLIPVADGGGEGNENRLILTEATAKLSEIETA